MVSAYYLAHMSGRFLGIFISHLIPIQLLLLIDLVLGVVVAIIGKPGEAALA